MLEKIVSRATRRGERAAHRWRVGAGLLILAGFVAIGVVPARRGLTVRYHGTPKRRNRAQGKGRRQHIQSKRRR
jgi:hypothetical protein